MENNKIIAFRPENIIEARYSLTTRQNNIIDMVLSEISDDNNFRYTLTVDKYKKIVEGDTSNIYRDLKKASEEFEKGDGLSLIDANTGEKVWFSWFSKIRYKDRKGEIEVNIDPDFKQILYEAKKRIYYDLNYTLNFKSSYSQRFYYYAKSFEDTGWRIDKTEDLIDKLECPESYKNFAMLKKKVLDRAEEEIKDTDIIVEYKPIKTGRKVTHIKTIITPKDKNIVYYREMSVDYILNTIGGLINGETDANKIIKAISNVKLEEVGSSTILEYYNSKVDYVIEYQSKHKNIPFIACILNAIKNNWATNKQEKFNLDNKSNTKSENNNIKKTNFHNFEPRQRSEEDWNDLENNLLGWNE